MSVPKTTGKTSFCFFNCLNLRKLPNFKLACLNHSLWVSYPSAAQTFGNFLSLSLCVLKCSELNPLFYSTQRLLVLSSVESDSRGRKGVEKWVKVKDTQQKISCWTQTSLLIVHKCRWSNRKMKMRKEVTSGNDSKVKQGALTSEYAGWIPAPVDLQARLSQLNPYVSEVSEEQLWSRLPKQCKV